MTRLTKTLKDGLFLGAFLVLASLIVAKIDLDGRTRIAGPFFAIDGDTLAAGVERLRLIGIDAPEGDQTCGGEGASNWRCGDDTRKALSRLASSAQTECFGDARDRYGRILVHCRQGETDINAAMVMQGMAVAAGDYYAEEGGARDQGRGVWSGPFDRPGAWRAARGAEEEDGMAEEPTGMNAFLARLQGLLPW